MLNELNVPEGLSRLSKKLMELDEAFGKKGLSQIQIEAYKIGLDDLSEHEIEIGCSRAMRRWTVFNFLPPPAFIRECAAAAMEEERNAFPRMKVVPMRRLTLEEAWAEWEEIQEINARIRALLGIVEKHKKEELRRVYAQSELVLADYQRLAELHRQAKLMEEKYGKGSTVRVRNSVPSKADQGTSGKKREPEKRADKATDNGAGRD